ncbi:putative membrane protein [Bacteriovorax sp. BAL6_X]|nr:putative membrane protein [Bacteriovorax sp. BAL6_X]
MDFFKCPSCRERKSFKNLLELTTMLRFECANCKLSLIYLPFSFRSVIIFSCSIVFYEVTLYLFNSHFIPSAVFLSLIVLGLLKGFIRYIGPGRLLFKHYTKIYIWITFCIVIAIALPHLLSYYNITQDLDKNIISASSLLLTVLAVLYYFEKHSDFKKYIYNDSANEMVILNKKVTREVTTIDKKTLYDYASCILYFLVVTCIIFFLITVKTLPLLMAGVCLFLIYIISARTSFFLKFKKEEERLERSKIGYEQ